MGVVGFGYQGQTINDLVSFAKRHGIAWVADVRLTPLSRRPGFSKRVLAAALSEAGIGYIHLPALGNPRDNRAGYASAEGEDARRARRRYAHEVLATDAAQKAVNELRDLIPEGVAVLCFEQEECLCHRQDVLAAVERASTPAAIST